MSRYRDPQLQVGGITHICLIWDQACTDVQNVIHRFTFYTQPVDFPKRASNIHFSHFFKFDFLNLRQLRILKTYRGKQVILVAILPPRKNLIDWKFWRFPNVLLAVKTCHVDREITGKSIRHLFNQYLNLYRRMRCAGACHVNITRHYYTRH